VNFLAKKDKILKKIKDYPRTYIYDYRTFDLFAKLFNKDLFLSGSEVLVVKEFPSMMPFVLLFIDIIDIGRVDHIKERARTLLRHGICTLIVSETISSYDIGTAVNVEADTLLQYFKYQPHIALSFEPIFAEKLALPRARDL
jgi:hypothetical protein